MKRRIANSKGKNGLSERYKKNQQEALDQWHNVGVPALTTGLLKGFSSLSSRTADRIYALSY
jgi:hypothetical protein